MNIKRIQNDVNFQVNMRSACNKWPAGLTRLGWDSINSPKMFLSGNRVHREQKVTFTGLDSKWAWVEQDENMWNVFKPLSFVLTESDLKIGRRGRNRWSWGMKTKRTAVRVEIWRNWEIFLFLKKHCTALHCWNYKIYETSPVEHTVGWMNFSANLKHMNIFNHI